MDFSNCKQLINRYKGSDKKIRIEYYNKIYMLKFPDRTRGKAKEYTSYIGNIYSEYIGSKIFKLCGFDTQNVLLGTYKINNDIKDVVACEDFTTNNIKLSEIENVIISDLYSDNNKLELSDLIDLINRKFNKDFALDILNSFWDMFIIDFLIGNTDRHTGNWGILYNEDNNEFIRFAPIYDCGSCLNPILRDDEILELKKLNQGFNNQAINCHSVILVNNKRINYSEYIISGDNKDVDNALLRVFNKIDIDNINKMIDDIDIISDIRNDFYKEIISIRYHKILKVRYNKLMKVGI